MPVTIKINGANLSLAHKGSDGFVKNTLPDVCKSPTTPAPYVIFSFSRDLKDGTKSIHVDGGNMAANYGSQFSRCTGDEPGVGGGVKSGTNLKEAKWITYSFDVKLEGRGACRLTDKMTMNHANTVCLGGLNQAPVEARGELIVLCEIFCLCNETPVPSTSGGSQLRQECVKQALLALDNLPQYNNTMKPEISYDMTKSPPAPLMHRDALGNDTLQPSHHWQSRARQIPGYERGTGMVRRPDVVIVRDPGQPPYQSNLKAVVEMKFPGDVRDPAQIRAYEQIAGGDKDRVVELDAKECGCGDKPLEEPVPVAVPELEFGWWDVALLTAAAALILTPIPGDEVVVGAGAFARFMSLFGRAGAVGI